MDIHNEFIAVQYSLVFYAGKPVLNLVHEFVDFNGDPWSFASATGFSFKVWEEREGGLLMITWLSPTNLSNNANNVILNAPATDTNIGLGKYYYEMECTVSGGYPVLLMYGEAKFI